MRVELIMAEFGEERKNMGGNVFDGSQRLDPTLTTFTNNMKSKHDLKLTLYPWLLHHKMSIYSSEKIQLKITEYIDNRFFLLLS